MAGRAKALHILTNNSGNYIKLHNGSTIGVNLKDDLRQYFTLLFMFDHRYDYYNWIRLKVSKDRVGEGSEFTDIKSDYLSVIPDEIINYIKENAGANNIEIPSEILDLNLQRDDSYKLGKTPYLEIIDDDGKVYYYIPKIIPNEDYRERAIIKSDLEKLDTLFKTSNYSSIDELVLLDFYKEFKNKIENLKDKIIENDDEIKKAIETESLDKLKILYKIKIKNDDKISKKINENIIARAKNKENLNFINSEIKGGGIIDSDIFRALNNIKKKTTDLDDIDLLILKTIERNLKYERPDRPDNPDNYDMMYDKQYYKNYTPNKYGAEKGQGNEEYGTNVSYNYGNGSDKINLKEFVGDNSIKKNIKYLKLIKYFSELKYNEMTGGAQETQLQKLTTIYDNLKDIYINIVNQYIKFDENYENNGKILIKYIENQDTELDTLEAIKREDDAIVAKARKANEAKKAADEVLEGTKDNAAAMKEFTVKKLSYESDLEKLEKLYSYIGNIEKSIIDLLTKLYKVLINLKEASYSAIEYKDDIDNIIVKHTLKTVEKSDIIIELRAKKEFLKKKIEEFNTFKTLTNKIYSDFKSYNQKDKYRQQGDLDLNDILNIKRGGGSNESNEEIETKKIIAKIAEIKKIYDEDIKLYKIQNLIKSDGSLYSVIKLLQENIYNNNVVEPARAPDKIEISNNEGKEEKLIYQELWDDYNKGVKSKINANDRSDYFIYIDEGEKLKNSLILNDLDPELVLKINLQDKAVFLLLIFIIRTISVVIIELLIEYNIVKTLQIAISVYIFLYLSILAIFVAFINLDAYKLRIIFNYLNMHINTANLSIHIILFIIFSVLVIIIIQTDNFINNVGDILDYTYIYEYLFNLKVDKMLDTEFENNISPDEKTKLLYRLDIVTMIIFIFTGALVIAI
jgi:hypothetical protein